MLIALPLMILAVLVFAVGAYAGEKGHMSLEVDLEALGAFLETLGKFCATVFAGVMAVIHSFKAVRHFRKGRRGPHG